MKRHRIPGLIDQIEVDSPEEISRVVQDSRADRQFYTPTALVNWFLLKRSLSALSFAGKRFPTMKPRDAVADGLKRENLWKALDAKIPSIRQGPPELEPLALWVSGAKSDPEVGILTQQLLGELFSDHFVATPESWNAAKVLVAAPRLTNLPKLLWWTVSGKVRRAKQVLADMVNGDLAGVNAIGIAVHNVVKGLQQMKRLYLDDAKRSSLSAEQAAQQCLFAPISVYRQAISAGSVNGCPFSRGSLFILNIGIAARAAAGRRLVFLEDSWSRCPAADWVPAMFEGVWKRASCMRHGHSEAMTAD